MSSALPPFGRIVIVPDTTEMFGAHDLASNAWVRVFSYAADNLVRVRVPEVVVQESVRHRVKKARIALKEGTVKFNEARVAFEGVGLTLNDSVGDLRAEIRRRQDEFDGEFRRKLADKDVGVLPLPDVSHETLLGWAMAERQPFKDTGVGYRDALIWATVLELATSLEHDDEIWFVSNNVKDFHQPDGFLSEVLRGDLRPDAPRLTLYRTLNDMLEAQGEALKAKVERETIEILLDGFPSESDLVQSAVVSESEDLVGADFDAGDPVRGVMFTLPGGLENPTFYSVEPHEHSVEWHPDEELDGGTVVGTATLAATVGVDGYMAKAVYFATEDGDAITALDLNYNDDYVWVSTTVDAELRYELTIRPGMVDNVELVGYSPR